MAKHWELETEHGVYFWGGILSNWAKCSFAARLRPADELMSFNCSEQYMMRVKAAVFGDETTGELIMQTPNPREQKRLGRTIKGYSDAKWDAIARDLAYIGVYNKFAQNDDAKALLLSTGSKVLVEASPKDKKWGVGLDHHDLRIFDKSQWLGTNWLGQNLMKVRDDLALGITSEFMMIDWTPYE